MNNIFAYLNALFIGYRNYCKSYSVKKILSLWSWGQFSHFHVTDYHQSTVYNALIFHLFFYSV